MCEQKHSKHESGKTKLSDSQRRISTPEVFAFHPAVWRSEHGAHMEKS